MGTQPLNADNTSQDGAYKEITRIVKGSGINLTGSFAASILGFIHVWILALYLPPDEVGLYYLGFSIISIISTLALAGTENGIRRFVAIYQEHNDIAVMSSFVRTALWVALPLSLILATFLYVTADFFSESFFSKPKLSTILQILSIYLPFHVLTYLLLSSTQALKHMQYKVICLDITYIILKIIIALILFLLGFRLYGAVTSLMVAMMLVTGLAFYYYRKVFPCIQDTVSTPLRFNELLSFSVPQSFTFLLNKLLRNISTLMLGYFAVSSNIGFFNIAEKIIILSSSIVLSFNTMLAPIVASLHATNQKQEFSKIYKTVTKWCVTLGFPVSMLTILLSHQLMGLFGQKYSQGAVCLIILAIGQMFNMATGPAGLLILMTGRVYVEMMNMAITLLLCFSLNFMLIPKYNYIGAAAAVAISMGLVNILRVLQVYWFEKILPYNKGIFKPIVSCLLCVIVYYFIKKYIITLPLILFLLISSIGFVGIFIICLYCFRIDETDKYIINKIKARLARFL